MIQLISSLKAKHDSKAHHRKKNVFSTHYFLNKQIKLLLSNIIINSQVYHLLFYL